MLAFDRITDGVGSIFIMNAAGSNLHELTPSQNDDDYWGVWSPDGPRSSPSTAPPRVRSATSG